MLQLSLQNPAHVLNIGIHANRINPGICSLLAISEHFQGPLLCVSARCLYNEKIYDVMLYRAYDNCCICG